MWHSSIIGRYIETIKSCLFHGSIVIISFLFIHGNDFVNEAVLKRLLRRPENTES